MPFRSLLLILLLILFSFTLSACQKEEPVEVLPAKIVEEPLPEITAQRLTLWVQVAADLSHYIRRFALDDEAITSRRDVLMLAHSSPRTQLAYGQLFDKSGMEMREFWNIIYEAERVKKYHLLKHEESTQNKRIDILVEAGLEELDSIRKELASESSEDRKKRLGEAITGIESKIEELNDLKGDLSPDAVSIDEEILLLIQANRGLYEKTIDSIWKMDGETRIKKIMEEKVNK